MYVCFGNLRATSIHGSPIHASQVIRPNVRTLEKINPRMAAMATKTAVHAPWVETAFRPIDIPRILDPVLNI